MIASADEIIRGVVGAAMLLRNDARGMEAFDVSIQGFIKSFTAAVLILPLFMAVHWLQTRGADTEATPLGVAVLAYALQWAAFPLTAGVLAKVLKRSRQFVPYVIAANWASVVQISIVVVVLLIGTVLPAALAGFLLLAMTGGLLLYDYMIAKAAFETRGLEGAAVVMVHLLVGLLVQRLITG